jgi:hypothetical protein
MKFNAQYVVPIVILVVVVIISLCESCSYFKPYDSEGYDNISLPLETGDASYKINDKIVSNSPTQTINSALNDDKSDKKVTHNEVTPMNKTNYTHVPGSYDTISLAASAPAIRATFAGRENFATLNDVSSDYAKGDNGIDIYSQAKGSLSCEPSPYSNSTGYLCLNEMQRAQLNSRGGNQTEHN